MKKSFSSFGELKKALPKINLDEGLAYLRKGDYEQAFKSLGSAGGLTSLSQPEKEKVKEALCICGKHLQFQGKLREARDYFERARETDPNDIALLSRINLLRGNTNYRSAKNIGEFRVMLKEGFTEGKYGGYPYPFLTISGKYSDILQAPRDPLRESRHIASFQCLGVYRRQDQGRHLLSQLIRRYKYGAHPELAPPLAWLMADFIRCRTNLLEYIDIIIPLPSNPIHQTERGFTPCLLLAEELSRCIAIPHIELFAVAPMDCRFREMAFAQGKELIKFKRGQPHKIAAGKSVLLLDDVATSGRTLSLHADILTENGVKEIHALTIAKTGLPSE